MSRLDKVASDTAIAGWQSRPHPPSPSIHPHLPLPSLQPIPSRSFNKARDRSVGRSTRHLLRRANPTRESRSPIATAAKLAPPQFRGTWQPNRPYTLRLRKGRGNGRRGRGAGRDGRSLSNMNWKPDQVEYVSALGHSLTMTIRCTPLIERKAETESK